MSRKYHFTKDSIKRMRAYISDKETPVDPSSAEKTPSLTAYGLTDVGKMRSVNQDALVESDACLLYGVADGMGGHNGGETASAAARDGVIRHLTGKTPSLDALRDAITQTNAEIFRMQAEDEKLSGMGTTLSLLWASEFFMYLGHVGDSRIYRMRDGKLSQMTDDHSVVAELVRMGQLTAEQAENHPMKNIITRAVGTDEELDVDLAVEERRAGDLWLVCSDGLHGMVSDSKMEAILEVNTPEAAVKLLMEAALAAGGRDNISLVILKDGEAAQ